VINALKALGFVPWVFVLALFVKLARAWKDLPDLVASHFNLSGEPTSWMSKTVFGIVAVVSSVAFWA
jgi:uncharacterized membrane protein